MKYKNQTIKSHLSKTLSRMGEQHNLTPQQVMSARTKKAAALRKEIYLRLIARGWNIGRISNVFAISPMTISRHLYEPAKV